MTDARPHIIPGLGKGRRAALRWFAEHGPAHLFGQGDPSSATRKWLEEAGYVARAGSVRDGRSPFAFTSYAITANGRAALDATKE